MHQRHFGRSHLSAIVSNMLDLLAMSWNDTTINVFTLLELMLQKYPEEYQHNFACSSVDFADESANSFRRDSSNNVTFGSNVKKAQTALRQRKKR